MTHAEKHIVKTYAYLFESLSALSKKQLIESLSKSLRTEKKSEDDKFYESFGAFVSDKDAVEIIEEIKANRSFRNKDLSI
jgi:hypothetical protein